MTRCVIALTGISGVGKSTLIKALAESVPLEHLQASALIKEGRQASGDAELVTQDQLRHVDIDENQKFLIRGFEVSARMSTGLIILDGHTVIEQDSGLTRIDPRVFGAIGINSMIFLADDPVSIAARRISDATRKRPAPSLDNLRLIQETAQAHASTICGTLGIPLHIFRTDQPAQIGRLLLQQCVNRG